MELDGPARRSPARRRSPCWSPVGQQPQDVELAARQQALEHRAVVARAAGSARAAERRGQRRARPPVASVSARRSARPSGRSASPGTSASARARRAACAAGSRSRRPGPGRWRTPTGRRGRARRAAWPGPRSACRTPTTWDPTTSGAAAYDGHLISRAVPRSTRGCTRASTTIVARRRRSSSVSISGCSSRSGLAWSWARTAAAPARPALAPSKCAASATIRPPPTRLRIARSKREPAHSAAGARASISSRRGDLAQLGHGGRDPVERLEARVEAVAQPLEGGLVLGDRPRRSSLRTERARNASISSRSLQPVRSGSRRSSVQRRSSEAVLARATAQGSPDSPRRSARSAPPRRRGWSRRACAGRS